MTTTTANTIELVAAAEVLGITTPEEFDRELKSCYRHLNALHVAFAQFQQDFNDTRDPDVMAHCNNEMRKISTEIDEWIELEANTRKMYHAYINRDV